MPARKLVTQKAAAEALGLTDRTIRTYIAQGFITGYRMPGGRAIRVDLNELEQAITAIPTVRTGGAHKAGGQMIPEGSLTPVEVAPAPELTNGEARKVAESLPAPGRPLARPQGHVRARAVR